MCCNSRGRFWLYIENAENAENAENGRSGDSDADII